MVYFWEKAGKVEDKILNLVFNSLPLVVIGVFGAIGTLILSKRHLSARLFIGVVTTTAVLILSTDMIAIERGLSDNMRVFLAAVGGICIRELAERIRTKYKEFLGSDK